MPQEETNFYPYYHNGNSLYMHKETKYGKAESRLCNFVPCIESEKTVDDGATTETRLALKGIHSDGSILPSVEISASELSSFNWLIEKWGAKCIIDVGQSKKDNVRCFIQMTSQLADHVTEYRVTGWKKIGDEWQYLMPGDDQLNVVLKGKLQHYSGERNYDLFDLDAVKELFEKPPAPERVIHPLIAFTFLTPLNEFLRQAGCMPKFVLFLTGRTGTRKSTLAALFLSFFGQFTSSDLPMSFRDTANSILLNSFTLKDVLTCIDDYYPADSVEAKKLGATAQSVLRAYGDRSGRARLRADSTLMESRPPQGNAIVTGEISPNVGESGTARYFTLELKDNDVDLNMLTAYQEDASSGIFRDCMLAYTDWLKRRFLKDDAHVDSFITLLKELFSEYRKRFADTKITCHGRLTETVALLMLGMNFFLLFLKENDIFQQEEMDSETDSFSDMLIDLMKAHAESVRADIPTHIFIRKLYALMESGEIVLKRKGQPGDYSPSFHSGLEDDTYLMIHPDSVHRQVKKLCSDAGEAFPFTMRAIMKALVEEGIAEPGKDTTTRVTKVGISTLRLLFLRKDRTEPIAGVNVGAEIVC